MLIVSNCFDSEIAPITSLRLKIEINTREHFSVFDYIRRKFKVKSSWFNGETELVTYSIEELLGTKLRALYQRKQGRDLFDLAVAFEKVPKLDAKKVVTFFLRYVEHEGAFPSMKNREQRDPFPGALEMMILRTLKRQPCTGTPSRSTLNEPRTICFKSKKARSSRSPAASQGRVGEGRLEHFVHQSSLRTYKLTAKGAKYLEHEVSRFEKVLEGITRVLAPGES